MGDRNISIGGNATGNAFATGDHSTATVDYKKAVLPPAATVDINAEIKALQQLLLNLNTDKRERIETALKEAAEDAAKPNPDKDEVGKSLERALDYASKAADFAEKSGKIANTVQNVVGWLGSNWAKLLPLVHLVI